MESASTPALLLLDLPPSALAGIDLLAFTATPRFRGIKDLPPGVHFAFVGASAAFSERHGVWIDVRDGRDEDGRPVLQIVRWDPTHERLSLERDPAEMLRWRANLGEVWREGLAPYRQGGGRERKGKEVEAEDDDWSALTSCITPALLSRICGGAEKKERQWTLSSGSSALQDIEAIPGLSSADLNDDDQQVLHFLPINLKQTWRPGATGRERTEAAQDRSWALLHLTPSQATDANDNATSNLDEILGELQFCFVMLLTLNNFSCLEQWKRLLELILTSSAAVATHASFFVRALAQLRLQLQHCRDAEAGLIDLADEGGSLLSDLLLRFRMGIERLSASTAPANSTTDEKSISDVLDALDDLEDFLRDTHGWTFAEQHASSARDGDGRRGTTAFARSGMLDLEDGERVRALTTAYDADDELGEYAPQIVELTEEQTRFLQGGDGDGGGEEGGGVHARTDWGARRHVGMEGAGQGGIFVENRPLAEYVVEEDEDEDEDEGEGEGDEEEHVQKSHEHSKNEEDEEEMQDLDDMDERY